MPADRSLSPRTATIVIVAIIAVVLLVGILASGDGGGDTATDVTPEDDSTIEDPPASEPPAPQDGDAGPDVPPIACQSLITVEEADEALGTWDRDPIPSSLEVQQGETCIEQYADQPEYFVSIGPGEPSDFLPGARLDGVAGEPVAPVGDGAIWFDGDAGTLSVFKETPLGSLIYRVGIGRPDVDSATRLQLARTLAADALPRFPGVPPAEPTEVTFDIEPADLAGLSYVDNLRAKEEAGEWTHGDGLVATLELLAGRRTPTDVLRSPDLGDRSPSGVIRVAQNYVDDGADEEIRAALEELLDELLYSPEELADLIASATPLPADAEENISASPSQAGHVVPLLYSPVPAQQSGCAQNCVYIQINDKFDLIAPEPGTQGWTQADIDNAIAAVVHAAGLYEQLGDLPDITVVFTTAPGEAYTDMTLADFHAMYLNTDLQALGTEQFQQSIAGQMAISLLASEFGAYAGESVPAYAQRWWTDGLAVYLSGVAFPGGNREQEYLPDLLAAMEASTSLMERGPATWLFFEYLHNEIGGQDGVLDLIRSLPPLEDYPGIDALWHQFNELLVDGAVFDLDGEGVAFGAERRDWIVIGPNTTSHNLSPFTVYRLFISSPGEDGCVKFEGTGVTVSMRVAGDAGPLPTDSGAPGSWAGVPTGLIRDTTYELVVTTAGTGGTFTMETVDKKDADECSPAVFNDPPSEPEELDCSLDDVCAPSGYYRDLAEEVFEVVSEALKQSQNKEPDG